MLIANMNDAELTYYNNIWTCGGFVLGIAKLPTQMGIVYVKYAYESFRRQDLLDAHNKCFGWILTKKWLVMRRLWSNIKIKGQRNLQFN